MVFCGLVPELVSESQLGWWGQKGLGRWPELSTKGSRTTLFKGFLP